MKLVIKTTAKQWFRVKRDPNHPAWDRIRDKLWELHPAGFEIHDVILQYKAADVLIVVKGKTSTNPFHTYWPTVAVGRLNGKYLEKAVPV